MVCCTAPLKKIPRPILRADEIGNLQMTVHPIRLEASQKVAKKVVITALMETTVSRYELRDGGPYGVGNRRQLHCPIASMTSKTEPCSVRDVLRNANRP